MLEDIRRTAWDWNLTDAQVLASAPSGYDAGRIDKEIEGDWPEMTGFQTDNLSDPDIYRTLPADGAGYPPGESRGFLVHEPLRVKLSPSNYQAFLLAGGITSGGGIDTKVYCTVYCAGDMAGALHLASYATAIVKGNLSGSLSSDSYFIGFISGDLSGSLEATTAGVIYVKGGVTGMVRLGQGAKLWIGGHTTREDLARIHGPGKVWLADTDLPAGTHTVGDLTVTVEKRTPKSASRK